MGLRCIGGCGGSGAALRQEQKCSIGGKATGGGICGARHGGIIYRLKKIKISLEKERRRRLPAPFFCGKICQVLSVEIFLWMKYNRINCKICVKSAGNSAVFFGCGRVYFC